MRPVDVDLLWQRMLHTIGGLQQSGRLPRESEIFDSRLDIVKRYLKDGSAGDASRLAEKIYKENKPASFAAFELIKEYHLALGKTNQAKKAADDATFALKQYENDKMKAAEKERQRYSSYGRKKGSVGQVLFMVLLLVAAIFAANYLLRLW